MDELIKNVMTNYEQPRETVSTEKILHPELLTLWPSLREIPPLP